MTKRRWLTFGILAIGLGVLCTLSGEGYSQAPGARVEQDFLKRLAKKWNMKEEEVSKKLQELGQELQTELGNGRTAELPGLGRFQVVRVMPHRESREGRPVLVETNTVKFVPAGGLAAVANSPQARPVETILPADYFYQDFPYGGAAIDRNPPLTVGSGRDLNPANNPSRKVGGSRRP